MSTENTTREEAEAAAVEDGPKRISELYTFRTFTSLSFDRCMRLDIRLATAGQETVDGMNGMDVMRDAAFVGWMQTSPRAEVRAAFSESNDAVWDAVDEWEETFNDIKQVRDRKNGQMLSVEETEELLEEGDLDHEAYELEGPPWAELIREVARVVVTGKFLMVKLVDTAHAKELKKDGEQPPPN